MGFWLPIALANIHAAILAPWINKADAAKALDISATLRDWGLPAFSRAIAEQEKENEALRLFRAVQTLKAKQEAKENADQVHK